MKKLIKVSIQIEGRTDISIKHWVDNSSNVLSQKLLVYLQIICDLQKFNVNSL